MNFFWFCVLAVIWGTAFIGIKFVVAEVPPFFGGAARIFVGTVIAWLFLWRRKLPLLNRQQVKIAFSLGLLSMGIAWGLLFWGQHHITPALGSILNSTTVIFATLFSAVLLKNVELLNARRLVAVAIGFAGVWLIFMPELSSSLSETKLLPMLAVLGTSTSYGLFTVCLKRFGKNINHTVMLAYQGISAGVFLLTLSLLTEWNQLPLRPGGDPLVAILGLLYLGALPTFFGWLLYFKLVDAIGAVAAGAVTYVVPIVAIIIDFLVYGSWPSWNELGGAAMVFCSLALLQYRRR